MADQYSNGFDRWMGEKLRPFAKTWFEILRNLLVVALFGYIASKSTYSTLKILSFFTTGLFWLYCLSYVMERMPVQSRAKSFYVRAAMNVVLWAFFMLIYYSSTHIVFQTLDEVTKIQSH